MYCEDLAPGGHWTIRNARLLIFLPRHQREKENKLDFCPFIVILRFFFFLNPLKEKRTPGV